MLFERWEIVLWKKYLKRPINVSADAATTIDQAIKWKIPLTVDECREAINAAFGKHPDPAVGAKLIYDHAADAPVINATVPFQALMLSRFEIQASVEGMEVNKPSRQQLALRFPELFAETESSYDEQAYKAYLQSL